MFGSSFFGFLSLLGFLLLICLPAAAVSHGGNKQGAGGLRKGGPRFSPERGLPDESTLNELAAMYLDVQWQLSPEAAKAARLPSPTQTAAQELAAEFRRRFLDLEWQPAIDGNWDRIKAKVGAVYLRYSCDNSNPRSLPQQLRNCLEWAAREGAFIPWELVFADAAVSGTTAHRRGYQLCKQAISRDVRFATVLVIDEVGRAARDAIEALKLGRLIDSHGKRLVGVSDGFDSSTPQSKMMLGLYATLHEWFVDQLRTKVKRGQRDAFERGRNLGSPAFGYRLEVVRDDSGEIVLNSNGKRRRQLAIDEAQAEVVREVFRLLVEENYSTLRIAQQFNDRQAAGKTKWSECQIRRILTRRTYIGEESFATTTSRRDPETGQVTKTKKPESEWQRRSSPHLRIVPQELWERAQKRLADASAAFGKSKDESGLTRATAYARTLVRPVCGYCGKELILGNSGRHASLCCINGRSHSNGCKLHGYKSVRIIENCILKHLLEAVLTEDFERQLLQRANDHLAELAQRPKEDVEPLKRSMAETKAKIDRLVAQLENTGSDAVARRIRELETRLKDLAGQLSTAEANNSVAPPPVTAADVAGALADFRGLLNGNVAMAAPVLRALTGPITVTVDEEAGSTPPVWKASFTLDAVPLMAELQRAKKNDSPTADQWEYLVISGWRFEMKVELRVENVPPYRRTMPEILSLRATGASVHAISEFLGVSEAVVAKAIRVAKAEGLTATPSIPVAPVPSAKPAWRKPPKYVQYAEEVRRLRDDEQLSFKQIRATIRETLGADLKLPTITKAYDHARPDVVRRALEAGKTPRRGRSPGLGAELHRQIRAALENNPTLTDGEIAAMVGCSSTTIHRARRKLGVAPNQRGRARRRYIEYAALVVRLRDEQHMTWRQIAAHIEHEFGESISHPTLVAAYDYGWRAAAGASANAAQKPPRTIIPKLGVAARQRMRELIAVEPPLTLREIADEVGCGLSTVSRERQRIKGKGGGGRRRNGHAA